MATAQAGSHTTSVRKGVNVESVSIIWMVIEAVVAIGSGIVAHSIALTAFGADSIIELVAGSVLLWRLTIEVFLAMQGCSLWRPQTVQHRRLFMQSWMTLDMEPLQACIRRIKATQSAWADEQPNMPVSPYQVCLYLCTRLT